MMPRHHIVCFPPPMTYETRLVSPDFELTLIPPSSLVSLVHRSSPPNTHSPAHHPLFHSPTVVVVVVVINNPRHQRTAPTTSSPPLHSPLHPLVPTLCTYRVRRIFMEPRLGNLDLAAREREARPIGVHAASCSLICSLSAPFCLRASCRSEWPCGC